MKRINLDIVNRLGIGTRLIVLIASQVAILLIIGVAALSGLQFASSTAEELNDVVSEEVQLNRLATSVQDGLLRTVNDVYRGTITWQEAASSVVAAEQQFTMLWSEYEARAQARGQEAVLAELGEGLATLKQAFVEVRALVESENRSNLSLFVLNDMDDLVAPFITSLSDLLHSRQEEAEAEFAASKTASSFFLYAALAIILVGTALATLFGLVIYRSISRPIKELSETVTRVSEGDFSARADVTTDDELGELSTAFNTLLDERVSALVKAEQESERLNNSVINLIKAVSQLAQQRDLTVRAPVSEDITGAVADSLNLLAKETSNILLGVREISHQVADVSQRVKAQSDNVILVARNEQEEVKQTALVLRDSVTAMGRIAQEARQANERAESTARNTDEAVNSVLKSVEGIKSIRETIAETEKRIKRLGERSQEITGIVNLINSIAERTHILALNASMHAASAGEAGRGFAVVADEVQRLAENAREATAQISTLVNNIRVETADTVTTMNAAISQVADGTRLAEEAGRNMHLTKQATEQLVSAVQQIASSSVSQAEASRGLLERAKQIQNSTEQTGRELAEQTKNTEALVRFAQKLVQAIGVFKLPQPSMEKYGDTLEVEAFEPAKRAG